jgi:endonuclease/exonuclease/phosphatase family metal-dependent hydrolase
LVAVFVARVSAQADAPEVYTVASYNTFLMFDDVDNPLNDDERFQTKSEKSLTALASVLSALDADIVGLQEVEGQPVMEEFMADHMADSDYQLGMDNLDAGMFQLALLSKYPIKKTKRLGDSEDGQEAFRYLRHRILYNEVAVSADYTLHVFVVHLKASGDDRSRRMRADMTNEMFAWMTGPLGLDPDTDNIVIIGDFNDGPKSSTLDLYENHPTMTFINLSQEEPNPDFTMSSSEPNGQLDYIVASAGAGLEYIPQTARVGSVPSINALQQASDHLPIIAAFLTDEIKTWDEKKSALAALSAESKQTVERLSTMKSPAEVLAEKTAEELEDALYDDALTVAEVVAEARKMMEAGETPPVRKVLGEVMSEPDKLVFGRTQFSLMDKTGGIIVDERGADHFPKLPKKGDVILVMGRVSEYRGIKQITPVKDILNMGPAWQPVEVKEVSYVDLARDGDQFMSQRVRVKARIGSSETPRSGRKYSLYPPKRNGDAAGLGLDLWVPSVAFQSSLTQNKTYLLEGIVAKFRDRYQIQLLKAEDAILQN